MKKLFISGLIIFIIFFASGTMTWFTIDKNKYDNRHYTKTINSKIEHLSISTVTTNVNVISGKKLAVYFTGDNKINVTKNNKRLSIKEKRAVDRGYGLNFNPFHSNNRKLTIVVPEKDLKSLNIQSLLGEIDLNQVNLKHVSLKTDRIIQLKRSELNQVNIESSKANFYITDCLIREGRMKLDKGITHVKNSTLSDTVFFLFFGLFLLLITLIVEKPAVIFTLGIFLILIVPFIQPFIPMIPNIGDDIQDSFKYIPFTYLTEKMTGEIKFSNWQWFISIASIVVLFIANMLYASKRDI